MKKRLLSILLLCCMALTLLPTTAFAEGGTEVCTCETACTAESMNADCPVCGAEGAVAENCAKYVKPADDVPTQPESEPVVLNDEGETWTEINQNYFSNNKDAVRNVTLGAGSYRLTGNINFADSNAYILYIEGKVTLDLNGYELNSTREASSAVSVKENAELTLVDGSEAQSGAIRRIKGDGESGNAYGVSVGSGAAFIMNGGTIVADGYCVCNDGTFTINCGTIQGNGSQSVGVENRGKMYANGGTVKDCATLALDNYGTVLVDPNASGTVFHGDASNGYPQIAATISGGIFHGIVVNHQNGTISGGTFNGYVANFKGAVINGGVFNDAVWNYSNGEIQGTFNAGIVTGSGTAEDPYLISNAAQLKWFRYIVNSEGSTNVCAVLKNDINLENEAWTPIGTDSSAYTGTFDGGGHTISGLNVTGDFRYAGLFGAVTGGTIKNLTVAGSVAGSSTADDSVAGGIAGKAIGSTIEACANLCSVSANQYVGGIVGMIHNTTVRDCYNIGTISGTSNAGGIVGMTSQVSNNTIIANCYNVGNVSVESAANYAGGILGSDGSGGVSNCYYLKGTAENAIGFGSVNYLASKTAEEFADGTVLKLLKAGERGNYADPWADECKYLAAAGKTLSVFKGQGDAHTHTWGAWTSNGDGTRTHTCPCGVSETVNYSSSSSRTYYTIQATAGTGGAISPSGKVSVREGRTQVFTITPDQGYAVSDVRIDGESVGAVTSYTFENVRKAHTIEVSFAKVKVFVDVPAGSYYEDAVDWAVENGITQGTDDTHFSPDDVCTRAQMVTFLWRAAGSPKVEDGKNPFVDVKADAYYYDAVLWAVQQGVTSGTSATTFSPDATVTRGQTVTFLYRNAGSPDVSGTMPFADVEADAYYAKAVLWAVEQKITTGTSETTFHPMNDCTRGQIVTFLYRAR